MSPICTFRAGARALAGIVLPWSALLGTLAHAQSKDPTFQYAKVEEVQGTDEAQWMALVKAGLVLTTGNSRTTTFTLGAAGSRKRGNNKFSLEGNATYARSSILVAQDTSGNGTIEPNELSSSDQTTANAWYTKARYDRFLTVHNSIFLAGLAGANKVSGKDFIGGFQIGYSRLIYQSDRTTVTGEFGYDLSYESYLLPIDSSVVIHSLRGFTGLMLKLNELTSIYASLESLTNLNSEDVPNANELGKQTVDALSDLRLVAKAGLATNLWKSLSFTIGITLKYDHNPAPRAPIGGLPFAPGFMPFSEKLDTLTEMALIVNFL